MSYADWARVTNSGATQMFGAVWITPSQPDPRVQPHEARSAPSASSSSSSSRVGLRVQELQSTGLAELAHELRNRGGSGARSSSAATSDDDEEEDDEEDDEEDQDDGETATKRRKLEAD